MPGDPTKYQPPRVQVGDWLEDQLLGSVQVGGYHTAGLIPWPYRRRTGAHSLILTHTLAEAVRHESAEDIKAWFGVSTAVVWGWRKALGVDRKNNEGTVQRYKALRNIPPEAAARGREKAAQPEAREKMMQTIREGMPTRRPHAEKIHWTPKMDALLGTMPDKQAAEALGVSKASVAVRRTALGKQPYRESQGFEWTPERKARLGREFDSVLALEWGLSRGAVLQRRRKLGIPAFSG